MSKKVNVTVPYVNTIGMLGVAFVVLKLTGVINWSWWWVTLPFYGGCVVVALIVVVIVVLALIGKAVE